MRDLAAGLDDVDLASDFVMATHFASVEKNERNIPPGMIDDARKHVYEAGIRTPLVRLNYDGPAS